MLAREKEFEKNFFFTEEKRKKSLKLIEKILNNYFASLLAYKQSFLILNTNILKKKKSCLELKYEQNRVCFNL
jgi:hypothetical protein